MKLRTLVILLLVCLFVLAVLGGLRMLLKSVEEPARGTHPERTPVPRERTFRSLDQRYNRREKLQSPSGATVEKPRERLSEKAPESRPPPKPLQENAPSPPVGQPPEKKSSTEDIEF
ncbi:MAG: hypothetical protein K9N51_07825 [Candidatus Pacebacteria bacterium]|nr:hypothetical protein [Candidatus Paceibacterota bacterium]